MSKAETEGTIIDGKTRYNAARAVAKAAPDTEMTFINRTIKHLKGLDPESRERVVGYINSRLKSMSTQATLNFDTKEG